ncbi:MAG: S24/S26 family peptidase [Paludibacteraceae bacterium]|nr:S24/S26 family peptidase [Paludibacteraceae bacterium]
MEKSNEVLIPEFERLINLDHMVEFIPKGVSMRPFIEGKRDKVILAKCPEVKVGIIVLAKIGDKYVLHRVYKIRGRKIILRGDGNLEGYEVCRESDIIARVVRIKGKNGKRKRLTKACVWRHLPNFVKKFYLKLYRYHIKRLEYYEN